MVGRWYFLLRWYPFLSVDMLNSQFLGVYHWLTPLLVLNHSVVLRSVRKPLKIGRFCPKRKPECLPTIPTKIRSEVSVSRSVSDPMKTRWWFQILFIFVPIWRNDPIWLIFCRWVEPPTCDEDVTHKTSVGKTLAQGVSTRWAQMNHR